MTIEFLDDPEIPLEEELAEDYLNEDLDTQEESSWADIADASISKLGTSLGRSAGGLARGLGDYLGSDAGNYVSSLPFIGTSLDAIRPYASDLQEWGARQKHKADILDRQIDEEIDTGYGLPSLGKKALLYGTSMLPELGMAATGVGLAPTLAVIAARQGGERYGEYRDYGASPTESALEAAGSMAANALTGKIGLGSSFTKTPLARKALDVAFTNPLANVLGEGYDIARESAYRGLSQEEIEDRLMMQAGLGAGQKIAFDVAGKIGGYAKEPKAKTHGEMEAEINAKREQMRAVMERAPIIEESQGERLGLPSPDEGVSTYNAGGEPIRDLTAVPIGGSYPGSLAYKALPMPDNTIGYNAGGEPIITVKGKGDTTFPTPKEILAGDTRKRKGETRYDFKDGAETPKLGGYLPDGTYKAKFLPGPEKNVTYLPTDEKVVLNDKASFPTPKEVAAGLKTKAKKVKRTEFKSQGEGQPNQLRLNEQISSVPNPMPVPVPAKTQADVDAMPAIKPIKRTPDAWETLVTLPDGTTVEGAYPKPTKEELKTRPSELQLVINPEGNAEIKQLRNDAVVIKGTKEKPIEILSSEEALPKLIETAEKIAAKENKKLEIVPIHAPEELNPNYKLKVATLGRVSWDEIAVRPDLMQHRKNHGPDGETAKVQERLTEKYDPDGDTFYYAWLPKDPASYGLTGNQKFILVNGHNRRFKYHVKGGVKEASGVRLLRESDGWTPSLARALGAEQNIKANSADAYDIAAWFKELRNNYEPEFVEARAREYGLTNRKNAVIIGKMADDSVYTAFQGQKISEQQAATIAREAEGDGNLQVAALKNAIKGDSPEELAIFINLKKNPIDKIEGKQENIFETEDPEVRDRANTKAIAETLSDVRNQIRYLLPEKLKDKLDSDSPLLDIVQIDSPSAIAAIQKLDAQRQALRKGGWSKDPELKSQVSKLSDELYSQLLAEKQGAARQQKLLDESGLNWIIPDLINAASGGIDRTKRYIKETSRGINRFFNGGELDSLIDDLELADARNRGIRVETGGPSRSERFFEGYQDFNPLNWFSGDPKYNRAIPVARLARKGLRVLFAQQRKLARRFQNYPGIYNSNRDYEETRSMVNFDGQAELVKFFSLPSVKQERVGQFLQAARLEAASGNRFRETPDNLARLGLDEQEIQAYLDVRNYTNKSLGLMGEALKSDPPKWVTEEKIPQKQDALLGKWFEQVDNFIGGLINERYVPFSRFGKFAVWSKTANGGSGHLSFHETKESAKEQMKELVRQGARDVKGDIPIGRAAIEAYGYLPPALAFRLAQMDNFRDLDGRTPGSFNLNDIMPGLPPLAFNAHLVEAKLTPGWEKNIVKSLSDYNMGLATWVARKRTKIPFETALAGIDPIREKSLYDEAVRSRRRAQTPDYADKEISAVRKLFSLAYLSRPVTAMVNYLSRWTQTLPQLTKYIEDSPAAWYRMDKHLSNTANAYKQAWKVHRKAAKLESLFNRAFKEFKQNGGGKTVEMLRREYPEFFEATLEGVRRGIAGDEATQFFARKTTDHPNLDRMSDVLLSLFSGAEVATRKHAFITGYVLAKDFHNLQGDSLKSEAIRLGRQITLETQGDYSKANRPLVSTGYGALLTQFRLYSGFMLHEMRENMTPGQFKAAAGKLAIGLALGGVTTLPFYQQLEKMLQSMGFNPRLYVRKFMEKYFNSQTPADMAFYGTLGPLGVNISSSLAAGELAPGLESGGAAALGRTMLGVLPDPFQRVGRGYMYASEPGDENKVKAAEQWAISPTIRKLIQTGRYIVQGGKVTDKSGAVIAQLDPMDIAWTALGGTPMKEAKGYEDSYTMSLLEEQARKPNPIVKEIARARVKGDYGRASDLELEYFDKNKERVSPQAIKRAEEYIRDPYASRIKYAPKKVREELKGVRRRAGYE